MNVFLSVLRVFIEQVVSCLMTVCQVIRKWSRPDLTSDIVNFVKYERAHNAAVRVLSGFAVQRYESCQSSKYGDQ
jgi:hypothetical protein